MEVYKNITEMRQYLYTSFTNNLGSILCNYNSTGRKVFDASYIISLDSGNFLSGFASGAASSGIGSYAQSIKMPTELMIASTTLMGGIAAWATGGDFLQGAINGLAIGALNHGMHDNNVMGGEARCEKLPDGTLVAPQDLTGVTITGTSGYETITHMTYEANMYGKYRSQGYLYLYSATKMIDSYIATSGANNIQSYTLPSGSYTINSIMDTNDPKFYKNGIGFKAFINDTYDPYASRTRTLLRIHPCGGGTEGCIGLMKKYNDNLRLRQVLDYIRRGLKRKGSIPLEVIIHGR